jgi:hypothetical protein
MKPQQLCVVGATCADRFSAFELSDQRAASNCGAHTNSVFRAQVNDKVALAAHLNVGHQDGSFSCAPGSADRSAGGGERHGA